ncbi:PREDICTED: uncharacterized protein LOC107329066 [Acropora digitifera]|uniref:uncharacterized protein LOC107329066 n=1 Tax=Acropora digitifera TaxID=70779 RepID=UPI00077B1135|nr:PREDICTED: uncharacterized protein LOC107329066 [Acropora digitifera]
MNRLWIFVMYCLSQRVNSSQKTTEILIGALLSPTRSNISKEEEALKLAIEQVNEDTVNYPGIKLRSLIRYADPDIDFDNIEQVNDLLSNNVSVLIGPMQTSAVFATHPLCIRAHVPQIAPLTSLQAISVKAAGAKYLIRMDPTENLRAEVVKEIVKNYHWKTMAVLGYKDRKASVGHSAFRLLAYELEWNVEAAVQFWPGKTPREIYTLPVIKTFESLASTRLAVVFCPAWAVSTFLRKIKKKVDLKTWTWIFSDFGNQEEDLDSAAIMEENMSGLLGIKPAFAKGSARFQQFEQAWKLRIKDTNFTVSAGRVYDSVLVAAEGINRAIKGGVDFSRHPDYLGFCGDWGEQPENSNGKELARHLNEVTVQGVMGKIQANDPDSDARFDVVNLREDGQHKVIDHFTVLCLVAWPLDESEDGVDLVLIETSLLFVSILRISMITTSITQQKARGFCQNTVNSSVISLKGQASTHTTGPFFIPAHLFKDQSLSCDVMAAALEYQNTPPFMKVVHGGSYSRAPVMCYLVMGQFMEQRKTWMKNYKAAINRTMAGNFAFISDGPILDFASRQEEYCGKLKVTGGFGNTYGYGFAFGLDSPYTLLFNMELFRLQKDFIISSLTHKWTKERVKCELMDKLEEEQQQGGRAQTMTVQSMLGVFILLGISIIAGFVIMIIERIYASAKEKHRQRRRAAGNRSGCLQGKEMKQLCTVEGEISEEETRF